jgi:HEAT repeat protein
MSRYLAIAAVLCLAAARAGAGAGEPGPVERLKAESAAVELAASKELVAGGEKFIPDIQAAYAALDEKDTKFRERYRYVVARIRTAQVREWALPLAPVLKEAYRWEGLVRYLTWTSRLATRADARRAFCLVSRSTEGWSEESAVKVLGECLADKHAEVRRAAVDALDRPEWKAAARELLVAALKDEDAVVRARAAGYLVAAGDQRGLAALLRGALSPDRAVRDDALPVINELIVREETAERPRFKHSAEEVAVLARVMAADNWKPEEWNTRGTIIRLLGMVGDASAAEPLMAQTAREDNPKNLRRALTSLAQLRHRPAAALIPKRFGPKLSADKKNYNWAVAADWGDLGDPDTVPAMITLLGSEDKLIPLYAAFALGWAFAGPEAMGEVPLRGRPDVVLVPSADGKFKTTPFGQAPAATELKKAWEGFWAAARDKYRWSPQGGGLRAPAKAD